MLLKRDDYIRASGQNRPLFFSERLVLLLLLELRVHELLDTVLILQLRIQKPKSAVAVREN